MKKISAIMAMGFVLFITTLQTQAQSDATWQTKEIVPLHVAVTFSKTTNIVFPYGIVSVDIGSPDVLAQKAKGAENVLQIKAAKEGFSQTNLTIITIDGKLTSFLVDYKEEPAVLNLSLSGTSKLGITPITSESINQEQVERYASLASKSKVRIFGVKDRSFGIRLRLNGIFVHDDLMLLRLNIVNVTNINYDIDQLRLYTRDQKKTRRTATQEKEVTPLFVHNQASKIEGKSENTIVFVVPKFTIPDKKYFVVQLMENNGGRHLELHIRNNVIVKAVSID